MNEDNMIRRTKTDFIAYMNDLRFEYILKGEVYHHAYDAIEAFKRLGIGEQIDIASTAVDYLIDVDNPAVRKGWIRQVISSTMRNRLWELLDDCYLVMITRVGIEDKVDEYPEDIKVQWI